MSKPSWLACCRLQRTEGKKRNVRTAQRGEVKTFVYVQQRTLLSRAYRTRSVRARVRPSLVNSPERKGEKHLFSLVRGVVMSVPLLPLAAMALPLCARCRLFSCARDASHGNSSHGRPVSRCSRRTARRARERRPMARGRRVSLWAIF